MAAPRTARCFCLSKARDGARLDANAADDDDPALRAELEQLKTGALTKRAKAAGLGEQAVEEALDSAEPKAALIELIVARSRGSVPAADAALLSELRGMRLKALKARAREAGVDGEALADETTRRMSRRR